MGNGRNRLDDLTLWMDRRPERSTSSPPWFVGEVVDHGAMPTEPGRFYLLQPQWVSGTEAEGTSATFTGYDSPIPTVVLGNPPDVGDRLVACFVDHRWVADNPAPPTGPISCSGCDVPRVDLTLSWENSVLGPRSFPLAFNGVNRWASACQNQIVFILDCAAGTRTFRATYFTGGPCPTGSPTSCTSPGSSPTGLTLTSSSCDPLVLEYSVTACSGLASQGYTKFTVTL